MSRTQSLLPGERVLQPEEKAFLESEQTQTAFKRILEKIDLTWEPVRLSTSFGPCSVGGKQEFGPIPIRVNPRLTDKEARYHLHSLGFSPEDINQFIAKYFEIQKYIRTEIKGINSFYRDWFPYIAEQKYSGYAVEQITMELIKKYFQGYEPKEGTIRRRYETYLKKRDIARR
jgi:hypothetical protein